MIANGIMVKKQAPIHPYINAGNPVDPSSVTPATNINQLNLNWHEKDLPECERTKHVHRLHPYLGKYIPQLVEVFVRKYFMPGQKVFDPFCGSGTTLVQALEMGVHALGCDISAFNALLSAVKTRRYSVARLRQEVSDIMARTRKACEILNIKDFSTLLLQGNATAAYPNECSDYLKTWFAPQALHELLIFRQFIPDYENQDTLKIILTRAARSARLTPHYDLDFPRTPQLGPYYCYKHRRTCQPALTALHFLDRYGRDAVKRIEAFAKLRQNVSVKVLQGDSRFIDPGFIDGVITSPPYLGLIDYHDQHRYAFELLGLQDHQDEEIGSANKGTSLMAKQVYKKLIAEVFLNALQFMPRRGRLIVIAADKHDLYPEIAEMCNVKSDPVIERRVNRRTGMRSCEFYEQIFIWEK